MSYQLEITNAAGYLHVRFMGQFTVAAAKESVDAMVKASAREKLRRVLFDIRLMIGEMKLLDRYDTANYGASAIPQFVKVAMLARPDQISPDNFFENVARNRGVRVAVLHEITKATTWLID